MKHSAKISNLLWLWIPVTIVSALGGLSSGSFGGFIIALLTPPGPIGILQPNPTGNFVGSLLGGAFAGGIIGISQASILKKYFPRIRYWILASIISGAFGLNFFFHSRYTGNNQDMTEIENFGQSIMSGLVIGTIAGILQWFALIAQFPQDYRWKKVSFIWVLVSSLSMALSFLLLYFVRDISFYIAGKFHFETFLLVGGLVIYATLTGFGLLWLLKQR
jgi:hypothetical protein